MGAWARRTLRGLSWLALAFGLAVAAACALSLQRQALVTRSAEVSVLDVARAVRLLRAIDPRRQRGEGPREFGLSQRETELLLDQVTQRVMPAATRVLLQTGSARLQLSIALPGALAGLWLNVDASLRETRELPAIERLRVGALPVPGWAVGCVLPWALERLAGSDELQLARDVVQGLGFGQDKLVVRYVWHAGTTGRLLGTLIPRAERDRLKVYLERLATLRLKSIAGGRIPMAQLLPPMFALARQRSPGGADAAQENRSAILALAFAPFPRQLVTVVPAARGWRLPPRWRLTLRQREDFPLHFMVSAALAVEGGGPLADAIGVFKEMLDAGDGSGFSFNDIAADLAGRRFGQLALRAPERLQRAMADGVVDDDLLPDVSDLPEFIRPAEFAQRYGAVGSPAYQAQMADIEVRLDSLALYR